jgi:glutaredoxin
LRRAGMRGRRRERLLQAAVIMRECLADALHGKNIAAASTRRLIRIKARRATVDTHFSRRIAMKLQLLVSQWCPTCPAAQKVWSQAAARTGLTLEVLDVGKPEGRRVVSGLGIRTVPAMVIDGKLRSLGTCTLTEALSMLSPPAQGN